MEQNNLCTLADFSLNKEETQNAAVIALNLFMYLCPSEVHDAVSEHDYGKSSITSYGWCTGDWFIWGGFNGPQNRATFGPNRSRRMSAVTDGLSQTVFAAEVKMYQPTNICDNVGLSQIRNRASVPAPIADPVSVAPEYLGGCHFYPFGHTEWIDGNTHGTGFTTAWTPNKKALGGPDGKTDMDVQGINEEKGGPTFAVITARSFHTGGVNVMLGDRSVRFISDSIDGHVWRAYGSAGSGEVFSMDTF